MGYFGTYLFESGAWRSDVPPGHDDSGHAVRGGDLPVAVEPWLLVDIRGRAGLSGPT